MNFELCIALCPLCGTHSSDCYRAPAAGYRNRADGFLTVVGTYGEWWSASPWSDEVHHASHLAGTSEKVCPHDANGARAYAFSVRCVQASAGVAFVFVRCGSG